MSDSIINAVVLYLLIGAIAFLDYDDLKKSCFRIFMAVSIAIVLMVLSLGIILLLHSFIKF